MMQVGRSLAIERLTLKTFMQDKTKQAFDKDVEKVPHISTLCSASDWQIAAYFSLHEEREAAIWRDGSSWMLSCLGTLSPFRRTLQPLEMSWAFGCPLIASDPQEGADFLLDILQTQDTLQLVMLSGIPRHSPLKRTLIRTIGRYYQMNQFEGAHCMQSDLLEGPETFLSRRSSRFRANIRRSTRRANEQGIELEWLTPPIDSQAMMNRAMQIEQRSWKMEAGTSIFLTERYERFYQQLTHMLSRQNRLRGLFLTHEGEDVAYVFGGLMGKTYRGFQLSYDQDYANLSLGHLAQWQMIQHLYAQDKVELYDLGMEMDYKARWSDQLLELDNLLIFL